MKPLFKHINISISMAHLHFKVKNLHLSKIFRLIFYTIITFKVRHKRFQPENQNY